MLRDYQEDISTRAAAILHAYGIVYLSMQVRTGKTLTALATAEKSGARNVLFVTKKKAIGSIEGDDEKYDPSFTMTCTNYEQLYNIMYAALHNSAPENYDLVILDEAHCISQYPKPAKRTKLLKQICAGKPIIYLSGTPTPESYSQLFHQFWVSSRSPFAAWPNFYKWAGEFVTVRSKYYFNREIKDYSNADKSKIDLATNHLFISFTQEEAGFQQPVKEEILTVRMADSTYLLADYLRKHRVHVGRDGQEILADSEVKLMNKLHQIYSGTVIAEDKNGICFDHTKAQFIRDRFAGKKIGIFYKFREERASLIWTFGADRLTEIPEEFNAGADKIFISQIQAGREGINLSSADCLVMLNIDFAAVSYWQARARLQDKNRTKEAVIYWVFAEGGIEQKIYERVLGKRDYTLAHFKRDYKIEKERKVA